MMIADDPAAFLALLQPDATRARHCRAAARTIPGLENSCRANVVAQLEAIAIEFLATHSDAVAQSTTRRMFESSVAAVRTLGENLAAIAKAVAAAPRHDVDRYQATRAAFATLVEMTLPGMPSPIWDPDAAYELPYAGQFARMASDLEAALTALGLTMLPPVTRPRDAAFDRAIARLALLFEDAAAKGATASGKSTDPTYRPPFARFVTAFWPAISREAPPTNKSIAAALEHRWSYALDSKSSVNSGDSQGGGVSA